MKLFITIIAVIFFAHPAFAIINKQPQKNGNLDITLSPVFFEYNIKNQKQILDHFSLRNNSNTPMELIIELYNLGVDPQGKLTLQNSSDKDKWIKIDKNRLSVAGGETATVSFEITVPAEAAYGNYWAISVASNNEMQKSGNISLSGSANIPILLRVDKPGAISNADILEFNTKNKINEYLPVDFVVSIKNTGNTHVRPRGNIFINDHRGKNIAILDINKDAGSILPNGIQDYISSWTDGFFVKDNNGKILVQWEKPAIFRLGKYTAHLFLVFDGGKKDITLESKIDFWVIPYTMIIGIILIVIGLIFVFRILLKIYVKSQIKKYSNGNN